MEIIRSNTNFDFLGKRKYFIGVSIIFILISLASLIIKGGPRFGIEFTGGAMVQVAFNKDVSIEELRTSIRSVVEGTPVIQSVLGKDREFIIVMEKTAEHMGGVQDVVKRTLERSFGAGSVEISQTKMIGPKVGNELKQKGLMALGLAMICMLAYIAFRFKFDFGVGAVLALMHDVTIMIGFFSITNREFDLTFVAALLTIVGFSVNDTVVVFDRIRELINRMGNSAPIEEVMNRALNETLSRTILTSLTVLLCVVVLFVLGGAAVHDFATALLVGVVAGTYSSIYVASPVVIFVRNRQAKKAKAAAAGA